MNKNENGDIVPKLPTSVLHCFKLVCKRSIQTKESEGMYNLQIL